MDAGIDAGTCRALNAICDFGSDCCSGVCGTNATCVTPGTGDGRDCMNAADLVFSSTGTTMVSGDTRDAGNDRTSAAMAACSSGGPDRVYRFTVDADAVANFSLTASYAKTIALTGASPTCTTTPLVACQAFPVPINIADAELAGVPLTAGTYWVWADGSDDGGVYSLRGSVTPRLDAVSESCASPASLNFSNNMVTVEGSTRGRLNDSRTDQCGGGRGDVVYSFVLPTAGTVTANVVGRPATYRPVIYLRSDCAGSELACAPTGQMNAISMSLDAGTYFMWVDGLQDGTGTDGDFTLTMTR